MQKITKPPLFHVGQLVATPGALAALEKTGQTPFEFLARHIPGDWGELPVEDRTENYVSVERGLRSLSVVALRCERQFGSSPIQASSALSQTQKSKTPSRWNKTCRVRRRPPTRVAGRQKRIREEDFSRAIVPKCSQIVEIVILPAPENN
ncbi:MAG: hypothetical protein ABSC71_00805 [Candidatus Acidiferrales bacterium]|jgi:hypothetical protein